MSEVLRTGSRTSEPRAGHNDGNLGLSYQQAKTDSPHSCDLLSSEGLSIKIVSCDTDNAEFFRNLWDTDEYPQERLILQSGFRLSHESQIPGIAG